MLLCLGHSLWLRSLWIGGLLCSSLLVWRGRVMSRRLRSLGRGARGLILFVFALIWWVILCFWRILRTVLFLPVCRLTRMICFLGAMVCQRRMVRRWIILLLGPVFSGCSGIRVVVPLGV